MISSTTGRMVQNAARLMPVRAAVSVSLASICQNHLSPRYTHSQQAVRSFHASTTASAKKGKGSKNDSDDSPIVMPDMKNMDVQMEKKLTRLTDEFAKLRSGQPNTEIFRTVMVESGGARVSVADSGQLTVKSPTKMSISVFDPTLVAAVSEAIRECGMGLTPVIEGSNVVMSIPKPSKESKEALVKTARIIADKAKVDVRQVRKEGMDALKKLKERVMDDEIKRYTKDIDTLMEKKIDKITKTMKDKETEIMK